MRLDLSDPAERRMFYEEYDRNERDLLQLLVAPGGVVLDIGAHIGYFTLALAQVVGERGKVIAIEPSPTNVSRLREHVAANNFANVEVIEAAAASDHGELHFFIPDAGMESAGSSFLGTTTPEVIGNAKKYITVKAVRVDKLLADRGIGHVDLIKLDVEGGELSAFAGMDGLITGPAPPRIICEISAVRLSALGENVRAIHDRLGKLEYRAFRLEGDTLHLVEGPGSSNSNFENHLFLPPGDALLSYIGTKVAIKDIAAAKHANHA
jgi:FkbM family methyltransferase